MEEDLEANHQKIIIEKNDGFETFYSQAVLDKVEEKVEKLETKLEVKNKKDDKNRKDTQVVIR